MKKLLILFALLLSTIGCTSELVSPDDPEEKPGKITDSIHDFKPGSKDSVWLEEEK